MFKQIYKMNIYYGGSIKISCNIKFEDAMLGRDTAELVDNK